MKIVGAVIGCSALVAVVAAAAAEPKISVHAAGTASGGFTDNVLSAPNNPLPGADPRESDVFTELAPSALLVIDSARTLTELSYGVRLLLFAERDQGNSLNHQGDYRGMFLISPLSQLTVNARVRAGQSNALATDGGADASRLAALPFGENSFLATELNQGFRRQLDPRWSLEQTAIAQVQTAGGNGVDTRGIEVGAGVGGAYTQRRFELGASAGARLIDLERETMDATFEQRAVLGDLRAIALRDFGRRWNVRGEAGARLLAPVDDSFSSTVGPLAVISASFVDRAGEITATAQHSLEPNLFVARNTTSDRLILRGRLPVPIWVDALDQPRVELTGSIGYQRLEALALDDGQAEAVTDVYLGDVGLAVRTVPDLTVSLRYQYRRQQSDADLEETIPSFDRSTVVLSLVGVYPRRSPEPEDSRTKRLDARNPVMEERQ